MDTKICVSCGLPKKFPEEFNSQGRYCLECHKANSKKWASDNPEKVREISRKQREKHANKATFNRNDEETKICPSCPNIGPQLLSMFNSLGTYCKKCSNERQRKWRKEPPERVNEFNKSSQQKQLEDDPEKYKERHLKSSQKHYRNNKDKCLKANTRRKAKITAYIRDVKKTSVCARCGLDDYRCLLFHHLRDKKFNIGEAPQMSASVEKVKAEIEKCIVLCGNCHMIEHFVE